MGVVVALKDFDPEERRDDHGRWTSGGANHATRDVLGGVGEASRLTDEQHAQMTKAVNDAKDRDPDLFSAKEGVQSVDFTSGGGEIVRDLKNWSAVNAFTPGKGSTIVINDYTPFDRSGAGWFEHATPATRTPYGTVTHELGHAFFYRHGYASKEQSSALLKQHGISVVDLLGVSDYALSDPREALAELYAMEHTPGFALPDGLREKYRRLESSVKGG